MNRRIWKLFFAWDYEKEETWLNQMAARGLHFIEYTFPGRYTFEEGAPGEYIYRLEYLKGRYEEDRNYIEFLNETGVEQVTQFLRWGYFRKKSAEGPFELYSDIDSRIGHYRRISSLMGLFGFSQFFFSISRIIDLIENHVFPPWIFLLHFVLAALFCWGFIKLNINIARLKKEKTIRE